MPRDGRTEPMGLGSLTRKAKKPRLFVNVVFGLRRQKEFLPNRLRPWRYRSVVAVVRNPIAANIPASFKHFAMAGNYQLCHKSGVSMNKLLELVEYKSLGGRG